MLLRIGQALAPEELAQIRLRLADEFRTHQGLRALQLGIGVGQ